MTSVLAARALDQAGLSEIATARAAGDLAAVRAQADRLATADILALGALADAIRAREVGSDVRVHVQSEAHLDNVALVHPDESGALGVAFLRKVATARILGEKAAPIAVDWVEIGLELAQVALGFGASELSGVVSSKRGLPIAEGETKKVKGQGQVSLQALKLKELEVVLSKVGRRVVLET